MRSLGSYVTIAYASTILGVTPAEAAELADAGDLDYHDDDGRLLVSLSSVLDRKAEQ